MFQDLRQGIRVLLQNKGWTAVIVLSLAIGIGANTALFSAVNGLFLKSIPVRDPRTLVRLKNFGKNDMGTDYSEYGTSNPTADGQKVHSTFPYAIYQAFVENNRTLSDVIACAPKGQLNVVVDGQAEIARGFVATGNFYRTLGIDTILGRPFLPDDDQRSANPVAVISEGYWKRRFGGSRDVIGKTIHVNNTPVTIVGVTGAGFTSIQQSSGTPPDLTLPLAIDARIDTSKELDTPTAWWLEVLGRLKPDMNAAQAQANLDNVLQQSAQAGWNGFFASLSEQERSTARNRNHNAVPHLYVDSASHGFYDVDGDAVRGTTILSVVVAVLLLIVCGNVANLLLSRAASRQTEISVRLSLGATRRRLVRQLLTESVLLALIGGCGGLLVGYWGRQLLPDGVNQIGFDWRLFAFLAGLTLLTGIAFGIAPALRATSLHLNTALKEGSRSVIGASRLASKALLVVQVAMSLVLLIGAGLFLSTLKNLRSVNVGFNPNSLLMFRLNPQLNGYDQTRTNLLYSQTIEQLRSVPGVQAVSLSQPPLLSGSVSNTSIFVEGHSYSGVVGDTINQVRISPTFFETLGIPLLTGRIFTDRDDVKAPKVAIINETAARKFFGKENPVGTHFGMQTETRAEYEVVGIVHDTKYNSLREDAPPTVYFPYTQRFSAGVSFEIRTAMAPASLSQAVRDALRSLDPNLPVLTMTTQTEQIEARLRQEKLFATSYALFGTIALLLASIGLFGLMSYNVGRRTNEIGIRMALGAQSIDVLGLVMKESMVLVGIGVTIGLVVAVSASSLVRSLVFGLAPTDPLIITFAVAILVGVAAAAGFLPARKASRVDPLVALHYD
jgi:predicted permease